MNDRPCIVLHRDAGHPIVVVNGEELFPGASQAIINHSPDGFEWGHEGSGPAQLALALLLHHSITPFPHPKDQPWDRTAFIKAHYQEFKRQFIARVPEIGGRLDLAEVRGWVKNRLRDWRARL